MKNQLIAISGALIAAVFTVFAFSGCGKAGDSAPVETAGESTVIERVVSAPSELSAEHVAYAYLGKQKYFSSYKSTTVGTTVAEKGFIKYEQKTNDTAYKNGDEYFKDSSSDSLFVKMRHQCYLKGDKVAYRNSSNGEFLTAEKTEYKKIYGVAPDDVALGGYIMNAESIISAEKTDESEGLLTFRYELDGAAAGANMKKQMKEFGGLGDYPVINSLTLYLTVKEDWTPVKLVVESNYDISVAVLGKLNCNHNFTTTFSDVCGDVEIPTFDVFN